MTMRLLTIVALCGVAAACNSGDSAKDDEDDDVAFAVFERWAGTTDVAMDTGTNVRTFNKQFGGAPGVKLIGDSAVELSHGSYHVTGLSITTFGYTTGQATYAAPGYAFLMRTNGTPPNSISILGSMQDARYSYPSFIDGIVRVESADTFILGHQQGGKESQVKGIFLEMGQPPDPAHPQGGHLFARLVIQQLTH